MLKISSCSCTYDIVTWWVLRELWAWLCRLRIPPFLCGVIRFLQAYEHLSYLDEEASSRVELFCCTTMYVRILSGRYKPCCVSKSSGTSSSILHTVPTWHRRIFSCFQKWRSTFLINSSRMMKTWRMLSAATWYEEGIHILFPRYDKFLNVKGDYVK